MQRLVFQKPYYNTNLKEQHYKRDLMWPQRNIDCRYLLVLLFGICLSGAFIKVSLCWNRLMTIIIDGQVSYLIKLSFIHLMVLRLPCT